MKYKKFINNTIMQYLMTFAQYVFPLLTFPYLTRVLEPEMYGVITYLTATVTFFQLFVDFGFNLSATKEIALNQNNNKNIGEILGKTILAKGLLICFSIIIFIITVVIVPILRENILLSSLYFINIILSIWLPDFLFRGLEKMSVITYRFLISKSISTFFVFVMVKTKEDAIWIPLLNIFGSIVAIIITWHYIKKNINIKMYGSSLKSVINHIKVSSVYFVSTFATTAFGIVNTFMLGIMNIPFSEVAFWSVSYNLIGMVQSLYTPITNSLYPHMVARKDFRLVKKLLVLFLPLIIVFLIIAYLCSELIIGLLAGKEYMEASNIFKALLPVLLFSFPAMVFGFPVLGAIGKVKETTITTVFSAMFHIIILFILAFTGKFTVLNIALLRSLTEFLLMSFRIVYLVKFRQIQQNSVIINSEKS